MSSTCIICSTIFSQKQSLNKHLSEKRCKGIFTTDLIKLNEHLFNQNTLIEELKNKININGSSNNVLIGKNTNCNNDINMKIEILVNPITNLNVKYMTSDKMKLFIETYDKKEKNSEQLNLLLSEYIKQIICNDEHPENHVVKYTMKKPPTFISITKDEEGNTVTLIKGLKDTCELLSDPILDKLKIKLKHFINKYKDESTFDYSFYEDSIALLRKEFKKDNVKKALSSVLQYDILNNIEMKFIYSIKPKFS